ncbi:MAG: GNAT family N-acetyltransferase [Rhodobacteraceae bacterium]|nr:GNAT family N-acetyltransferase [Paracoccaceae bacterium]
MIRFRSLTAIDDFDLVQGVFEKCADYVMLETGKKPGQANVTAFFEDHPVGVTVDDKLLVGIFDADRAIGVIDILCGYPANSDWYIGLLMIDPVYRGRGVGQRALNWVVDVAGSAGAAQLLLCVLDENPHGQTFWLREGFKLKQQTPPWKAGKKVHKRFEMARKLDPQTC